MSSSSRRSIGSRCLLVLAAALFAGCALARGEQGDGGPPPALFAEVVQLFRDGRLSEAPSLLQQHLERNPRDLGAYALLAHVSLELQTYGAGLLSAYEALRIAPCSSYAHVVLSSLYNPLRVSHADTDADSAWTHARAAVECDPDDGFAWLNLHLYALERGDEARASRALARLIETEFFTPHILAYNRWLLEALPPRAILVTNGDLDTFPALALQEVHGVRRDVAVVNGGLLNLPWYAERVGRLHDLPFERPIAELDALGYERLEDGSYMTLANRVIDGWRRMRIGGALQRDVAFAPSTDPDLYARAPGALRNAGAHRILDPEAREDWFDTRAAEQALSLVRAADFTGPATSAADFSLIRNADAVHGGSYPLRAGAALAMEQGRLGRHEDARRTAAWLRDFARVASLPSEDRAFPEELGVR